MRREFIFVVVGLLGLLLTDFAVRHEFYRALNGPSWAVVAGAFVFEFGAVWLLLRRHAALRAVYLLVTFASWMYFLELRSLPGVFGVSYILDEPRDALNLLGAGFSWSACAGVAGCLAVGVWVARWVSATSGTTLPEASPGMSTRDPGAFRRAVFRRRAGIVTWCAVALMLRHNLSINPGTALPFTDGIYAIGLAVARRVTGMPTAVRLTERSLAAEATVEPPAQGSLPVPSFNGILVIQESMRAHNLSAFGYTRKTTPELDRFLHDSALAGASVTRFTRAYSNATQTAVSVPSILAGRAATDGFGILRRSRLIYEELKRHLHLKTALIASHSYETGNYKAYLRSPSLDFFFYRELGGEPAFNNVGADDQVVADRFQQFLWTVQAGERFFVVLHLNGTHYPYTVPDSFVRYGPERAVDRYDDSIVYVDSILGKIFRDLESRGLAKNTFVAMTSDHGESFGEDGTNYHFGPFSDWNARVPALLVLPGMLTTSARNKALAANSPLLAENLDVVPTIRDIYGLPREDYPGSSWLAPLPATRTVCLSNGVDALGVVKSGDAVGIVSNRIGRECR